MGAPAILVIDNDPVFHAALAQALGPLADAELVTHGGEALRLLARKKYSVILLELNVRGLDGFVILRTMSAKPGPNKDTPVYVLTGDPTAQARLRALGQRALFVLPKTAPITTVVTLVETTLRRPSMAPPAKPPSTAPPANPPSVRPGALSERGPPKSGKPPV